MKNLIVLFAALLLAQTAVAVSPNLIIYEVFGGGGNSGAPYKNDYIILYNTAASTVNISGWSVQYASATGASWTVISLTGSIPANKFYLIKLGNAGGTIGADLPSPNLTNTSLNINAAEGKIAIRTSTVALSTADPVGIDILDKLGYGSVLLGQETTAATGPSDNTKAVGRKNLVDTDHNLNDFQRITPTPITTTPLPVTYLYFRANLSENQRVILSWQTINEANNNYFEIEKSIDLKNFSSIAQLKSKAYPKANNQYYFEEETPLVGRVYYRLKQVDLDESISYSRPISVNNDAANEGFLIYPNPSSSYLIFQKKDIQDNFDTQVVDTAGKLWITAKVKDQLDISNLKNGQYILIFTDQSGVRIARKFLKN